MVTVGAQHAITVITRALLARGDRAIIENPTYPNALDAFVAAGARVVPINVSTEDGWDEAALEQAIQRTSPSLGYLMPDYHNPTGRSMSPDLREKLLALAARHGTTIIADETTAELGIDGQPRRVPFATHGSAILVGSVGKAIWGGLRVGWIRADRSVIQRLARARSAIDLGTPVIEQLLVLNLLDDIDDILASRRAYLRAGRDHLANLLAERLPEWRMPSPGGGLSAWINLGAPVSSQLVLAARNEGLVIAAGPRFGLDGAFERFLRIPYSNPQTDISRAVDALAAAWASVGRYATVEPSNDFAGVV
jgi:DNA-binding transcriptional MocR family regulator